MKKLSEQEMSNLLAREPHWKFSNGKLVRVWKFATFLDAMAFVNHVADMAEAAGHHPDVDIRYNLVTLGLVTHDAGGVTERDAVMAATLSIRFPHPD